MQPGFDWTEEKVELCVKSGSEITYIHITIIRGSLLYISITISCKITYASTGTIISVYVSRVPERTSQR